LRKIKGLTTVFVPLSFFWPGFEEPRVKDDRRETARRQYFVRMTYLPIDQALDRDERLNGALETSWIASRRNTLINPPRRRDTPTAAAFARVQN
jgi:hypothetical protein